MMARSNHTYPHVLVGISLHNELTSIIWTAQPLWYLCQRVVYSFWENDESHHIHCVGEPVALHAKDHWTLCGVMQRFLPAYTNSSKNSVLVFHIVTDEGTFSRLHTRLCGHALAGVDVESNNGKKAMLRIWVACVTMLNFYFLTGAPCRWPRRLRFFDLNSIFEFAFIFWVMIYFWNRDGARRGPTRASQWRLKIGHFIFWTNKQLEVDSKMNTLGRPSH